MCVSPISPAGYFYVGSPFSLYPEGLEGANSDICRVMAIFVRAGIPAFSPIAHSYPISAYGGIDPLDLDKWLHFHEPMMNAASGLVVVKMPGWERSKGLAAEIDHFTRMEKPIQYLDFYAALLDGENAVHPLRRAA